MALSLTQESGLHKFRAVTESKEPTWNVGVENATFLISLGASSV